VYNEEETDLCILQGDCKVVRRRVCNGETHKVRSDGTRITCQDGKFKVVKGRKGKSEEENSLENCEWYGQVYCSGDVIQDLDAWWFKVRCSKGRMEVQGTQWMDVVNDPRFKQKQPGGNLQQVLAEFF